MDLPDLKVKRENLDFKEHLELEEYLDLKVLKAILVLQDSPETLVRIFQAPTYLSLDYEFDISLGFSFRM